MAFTHRNQIIYFISAVLIIYLSTNLYLFYKGFKALNGTGYRNLYTIVFLVLAMAFIAGRIIENNHSGLTADILNITGGFWLAFMLYATLLWLAFDIFLLINRLTPIVSPEYVQQMKLIAFIGITSFVALLITGGFFNAVRPVSKHYDITIDRHIDNDSLRIVAVSDIHLGSIIRKRSMRHLSSMIEAEHPDVVFLLGDVVDGSIGPVLRGDLLSYLKLHDIPMGVYAITGNHEFIGNINKTLPYIESKGIRVLKDEIISLPNGVQVAGRYDRSSYSGLGRARMSLGQLLSQADKTRPLIVLDHQPDEVDDLPHHGVDLQLSGHTHNGQMWPLTAITNAMYHPGYGYRKISSSNVIVSSGFGIWGPRVRIGTKPEIVVIDLKSSL
ncbi:MAG TPA: metallophosphoesterase [Bacteroidales bacterium]|nr:metallophosphoesterase [Bacteroidales bacterium]